MKKIKAFISMKLYCIVDKKFLIIKKGVYVTKYYQWFPYQCANIDLGGAFRTLEVTEPGRCLSLA